MYKKMKEGMLRYQLNDTLDRVYQEFTVIPNNGFWQARIWVVLPSSSGCQHDCWVEMEIWMIVLRMMRNKKIRTNALFPHSIYRFVGVSVLVSLSLVRDRWVRWMMRDETHDVYIDRQAEAIWI